MTVQPVWCAAAAHLETPADAEAGTATPVGAIAGAAVGVTVALVVVAALVALWLRRRKHSKQPMPDLPAPAELTISYPDDVDDAEAFPKRRPPRLPSLRSAQVYLHERGEDTV